MTSRSTGSVETLLRRYVVSSPSSSLFYCLPCPCHPFLSCIPSYFILFHRPYHNRYPQVFARWRADQPMLNGIARSLAIFPDSEDDESSLMGIAKTDEVVVKARRAQRQADLPALEGMLHSSVLTRCIANSRSHRWYPKARSTPDSA
jgi:hypothetical protein